MRTSLQGYSSQVEQKLTREFRLGGSLTSHDLHDFEVRIDSDEPCNLNLTALADLLDFVASDSKWRVGELSDEQKNELDAWLAPRIHATVRLPRRIAADRRLWTWLAVNHGNPYIRLRWGSSAEPASAWRYTGEVLRNALARLWWGAEMGRNGSDYSDVATIFRRTRTAQFALELMYSQYRPAAIAFARVVENRQPKLSDDQMKGLSKRTNALLSLQALESIGPIPGQNEAQDESWLRGSIEAAELIRTDPSGPEDNQVPEAVINEYESWFRTIA